MRDRYLEITFRKGKMLAAYLYLPRVIGAKSARTEEVGPGLLADYDGADEPIGLEITAPHQVTEAQINSALAAMDLPPVEPGELAPLVAA